MMTTAEQLHTVPEVAGVLHIHQATVWRYVRNGEIGHVRIGRRVLVSTEQLQAFIDAHRSDPDA